MNIFCALRLQVFLLICNCLYGFGQSVDPQFHPKIIPPSPNAQAFAKYGQIPVSHATGVPNIEIPIYEIETSKLKLPVSLNYHTSIKPSDIASSVGLGWKLNAGGVLTRSIKGKVDESFSGLLNVGLMTKADIDNAENTAGMFHLIKLRVNGHSDLSSDNYFYSSVNGLTGEFVYDQNKQLVKMSYNDHKINRTAQNTFEITDENGVYYQFDHKELTLEDGNWYPGSWWITKIISSDKTDTISFQYDNYPYTFSDFYVSHSQEYGPCISGWLSETRTQVNNVVSYASLLKKITFRGGYIDFNYLNDRLDVRDSRLKTIAVYNASHTLLKKVELDHGYFYSGYANDRYNHRLKLTAVRTKNGSDLTEYLQSFQYNETHILPPYRSPNNINSFLPPNAIDYWGYYNGKVDNPHTMPIVKYAYLGVADRNPNDEYAKSCILEKITYPTGGYTTFSYEGNRIGGSYGVSNSGMLTGGVRISEIITVAEAGGIPVKKRYEYADGSPIVLNGFTGTYSYMDYVTDYYQCSVRCGGDSEVFVSNAIVPLASFNGSPVIYPSVEEYTEGANNENLKTSYLYDAEADLEEYNGYLRYDGWYQISRNWARGNLLNTSYYKFKNGNYQLVKYVSNSFISLKTQRVITGSQVQLKIRLLTETTGCNPTMYDNNYLVKDRFYYFDEKVDVGIKKLESITTAMYDDFGNGTFSTENFTYGANDHLFVTKKNTVNSRGDSVETSIKYPHDFSTISPYHEMILRNSISSPVEEIVRNKTVNKEISRRKTNHSFFQSNQLIEPSSIETSLAGLPLQTEQQLLNYDDRANLLELKHRTSTNTAYVWGYNKQYPIAEVRYAKHKNVFLENFENGEGNTGNSRTGRLARNTNYARTLAGLDNGAYVLRYWQKNGQSWALNSINVMVTNGSYQIALSGLIDDVCFYPASAELSTYTYEPLVGMTSKTDPKGMITYYEYDSFGRLKTEKDHNGKVLRTYDYHYKTSN